MSKQDETDKEFNGSTGAILLRFKHMEEKLGEVETGMKELNKTLTKVRDYQLEHPLCSRPGLCVDLQEILKSVLPRIEKLERLEVRITTVCAATAVILPVVVNIVFKLMNHV